MALCINDLNDDELIQIFKYLPLLDRLDLPFVCRRWYFICKNYEVNTVQRCLGILNEINCDYSAHRIDDEDTIFNLMLNRSSGDNEPMFEQLLSRCSRLRTLSLRLVNSVDNRILNSIIKHCHFLEHFTISTTTLQVTNLVWLEMCTSVCSRLLCLNLEYVDNLTDHFISNILRKSVCLEHFAISANNQQLHGYFFEQLGTRIKSVSIKKVDSFTKRGSVALVSLITGNGRNVKRLSFKGHLTGVYLNQINLIQKNFKQLEELEFGDSLDDSSAAFQRIVGQTLAKISTLKRISFNLPQLTPFTITLNSLFNHLIEMNHQNGLLSFRLNGGEISDKAIELLCNNFKQLQEFHLSHASYFARENFSLTNRIFSFIAGLEELRKLTINGLNLNDNFLSLILKKCRQLTKLDLRNCWSLTNRTLISLELYAQDVEQDSITAYLWGTQISLLKLDENYMFTYPSNLKISFEPLKENLIDFDIIEDENFEVI